MTPTGPARPQDAEARSGKRGQRLFAWLIASVASVLVLSPAALAGTVTQPAPAGNVHVKGLTAKERAALDIVSVTATGENSLGVYVTATFKGNFERAVGRGHLKYALAALVLRFKPATRKPPAGLVTRGPGIIGQTSARTPSTNFGIARNGRRLTFFIGGAGSANLDSIEVKTFATQPRSSHRARGADSYEELALRWTAEVNQRAADAERLVATDLANASCDDLLQLSTEAAAALALADRNHDALNKLRKLLTQSLIASTDVFDKIYAPVFDLLGIYTVRAGVRDEIRLALQATDRSIVRTAATRDSLNVFIGKLKALIALDPGPCHPPMATPPPVPPPPVNKTLGATFGWTNYGPGEVKGTGSFMVKSASAARRSAHAGDAASPLTAVKVVVPPMGSTPRQITNTLCPTQLPTATVSTTTNPNDTLTCAGGSLPVGQQFTLNVQTSPAPTTAMGGQLFGQQDGTFQGPFAITGP